MSSNAEKKVIGYKIVTSDGKEKVHGDFESYQVIKESAAVGFINRINNPERWKLLTVFEGDIDNPEFINHL